MGIKEIKKETATESQQDMIDRLVALRAYFNAINVDASESLEICLSYFMSTLRQNGMPFEILDTVSKKMDRIVTEMLEDLRAHNETK